MHGVIRNGLTAGWPVATDNRGRTAGGRWVLSWMGATAPGVGDEQYFIDLNVAPPPPAVVKRILSTHPAEGGWATTYADAKRPR